MSGRLPPVVREFEYPQYADHGQVHNQRKSKRERPPPSGRSGDQWVGPLANTHGIQHGCISLNRSLPKLSGRHISTDWMPQPRGFFHRNALFFGFSQPAGQLRRAGACPRWTTSSLPSVGYEHFLTPRELAPGSSSPVVLQQICRTAGSSFKRSPPFLEEDKRFEHLMNGPFAHVAGLFDADIVSKRAEPASRSRDGRLGWSKRAGRWSLAKVIWDISA